jgi:hypothetical protein
MPRAPVADLLLDLKKGMLIDDCRMCGFLEEPILRGILTLGRVSMIPTQRPIVDWIFEQA